RLILQPAASPDERGAHLPIVDGTEVGLSSKDRGANREIVRRPKTTRELGHPQRGCRLVDGARRCVGAFVSRGNEPAWRERVGTLNEPFASDRMSAAGLERVVGE